MGPLGGMAARRPLGGLLGPSRGLPEFYLNFAILIPKPAREHYFGSSEQASLHGCKVDFAARSTCQNCRMVLAFSAFMQLSRPGLHAGCSGRSIFVRRQWRWARPRGRDHAGASTRARPRSVGRMFFRNQSKLRPKVAIIVIVFIIIIIINADPGDHSHARDPDPGIGDQSHASDPDPGIGDQSHASDPDGGDHSQALYY